MLFKEAANIWEKASNDGCQCCWLLSASEEISVGSGQRYETVELANQRAIPVCSDTIDSQRDGGNAVDSGGRRRRRSFCLYHIVEKFEPA
jgi:hypothetical protein